MKQNAAAQGQVQRFYDAEAHSYDASRYETPRGRRRDHFHKQLLLRLLEAAPSQSAGTTRQVPVSERVLEIGCGTGRLLEPVARAGFHLTGIDLSAAMLERARERLARVGLGDLALLHTAELPFPPASFSAVYSIFVVNLIPDYKSWLSRVASVLQPNGILIFNVPNLSSVYWPIGMIVNRRRRTMTANTAGARYSHWFARGEWERALRDAGFQIEEVLGEPPWCGRFERCRPLDGRSPAALLCKSLFIKARLNVA